MQLSDGGQGGGDLPLGMLGALVRTAGNRAVTQLITAQRDTATATVVATDATGQPVATPAPNPYGALDDADFNARTITNDLLRAINQSEHTVRFKSDKYGISMTEDVERERRNIDVPKVISSLENRTLSQINEIKRRYQDYEGRPLDIDLFGPGESGRQPDITADQRARIEILLKGTKADPIPPELQKELATYPPVVAAQLRAAMADKNDAAARMRQIEADAIELHELFSKKLDEARRERVMLLHRRPVKEIEAIDAFYSEHYGTGQLVYDITLRLDGLQRTRLDELRLGNVAQADAVAIEDKRRAIEALNKADEEYSKDTLGRFAAQTIQGQIALKENEKKRRALTGDIESIIDQNRREAMADTKKAGGVAVAERSAEDPGPTGRRDRQHGRVGACRVRSERNTPPPSLLQAIPGLRRAARPW